ncbi:MAG: hypothetical protein RID23_20870 [Roseovarius sp.]
MIVPKLWITLPEVRQRLLQHALDTQSDNKSPSDIDAIANEWCWDFCEYAKGVFFQKNGDKAIEYPKGLVAPPHAGKHLQKNEIIDLCVGIPGSGSEKFVAVGSGPKIYRLSGPHIGAPILFKRQEFEKFLLKQKCPGSASDLSEAGIKKALLEMHNGGTYTNKEAAWEYFKRLTTKRKFDTAFKVAKQEDPTFGKVGKPPSKKKQGDNPNI